VFLPYQAGIVCEKNECSNRKGTKNLQNSFYSNKLTVMNQTLLINTGSNIYMSET